LHFSEFQGIKFGIIQQTIFKVKLINDLVGHGKVDVGKITFGKKHTAQRHIIDFSFFKITIQEIAINKRHRLKGTVSEIAIVEGTIFKIFEFGIGIVKYLVVKFLV
jgi:hypothetical protein